MHIMLVGRETRANGIHSDRKSLLSTQECTSTQEHALKIETRITCKL